MELKAQLVKPYTSRERIDFIVAQNHQLGYEIRETAEALEAWGNDDSELLASAKEAKLGENERVRDAFLISGVIYKDVLFDSDLEQKFNLQYTADKMSETDKVNWLGMDGITSLECTKEDLLKIGILLETMTTYVWQLRNPAIKTAILEAQTMAELDAIEITYEMPEEE